ncbi:hypothetical protein GCK32_016130 [Trichostrongylus colubriformis]|uniref:Major facilitator superfamily (MFS) profile domain-containing protein n=1 Tax=Trichostrongylus colubriformis TaxID=6319 RepID=A0AAN8IE65_TRICO
MKEFNSDNTVCAMIISLLTGLTLGSGPLASAICNKYGCRATTITGALIAAVGRRSLATGIAVAGAGVGTVLFSPINEYIISHYGWRAVFLAFEGVLGLCVICGWTFRPLLFRELTEEEEAEDKDSIELEKPKEATIEESAALLTRTQEKVIPEIREPARVWPHALHHSILPKKAR